MPVAGMLATVATVEKVSMVMMLIRMPLAETVVTEVEVAMPLLLPTKSFVSGSFAKAGRGGNGGQGGLGTSVLFDGVGGNGGHGGRSHARLIVDQGQFFRTYTIGSSGGDGGFAYGQGAMAGDGGVASMQFQLDDGALNVFGRLYGGRGGDGMNGATAGNGASVFYGFQPADFLLHDADASRRSINFILGAGSGGNTVDGVAGRAGTARVSLGHIFNQLNRHPGDSWAIQSRLRITGGSGGRASTSGIGTASGRHGAIGLVDATGTSAIQARDFFATIRGGQGGSALGRYNQGNGGQGATAVFQGQVDIDNRYFPDGSVRQEGTLVGIELRGGIGGHAQGTGWAGNGAAVSLTNPVKVQNFNYVQAEFEGYGGDGGWGRYNGKGGDVSIDINQFSDNLPNDLPESANPGNLNVILDAVGGHAGQGVAPANAADGGNAMIHFDQRTNRSISVRAESIGGSANQGRGGDAYLDITGHALAPAGNFVNDIRRYSTIVGVAKATPFWQTSTRAAYGSNAHAVVEALAETEGNRGIARAESKALGGWGFLLSGSGDAAARAINQEGVASASAASFAFGDRDLTNHNFSQAHAHAQSEVQSDVFAQASSSGLTGRTVATTTGWGPNINSTSLVTSQATNWQHNVLIETKGDFSTNLGAPAQVTTGSGFSFRGNQFHATDRDVSSNLVLMPEQDWADQFLTANSSLGDIFVDDVDADILGLGHVHSGIADANADGALSTRGVFDIDFQVRDFHNDKNLILGLFETGSTGAGFSAMSLQVIHDQQTLFSREFNDLASANLFFDSQWLDLREMPVDRDFIHLDLIWTTTIDSHQDSFGFGFVFGNAGVPMTDTPGFSAVPEPSSSLVAVLLLSGIGVRRRRKNAAVAANASSVG